MWTSLYNLRDSLSPITLPRYNTHLIVTAAAAVEAQAILSVCVIFSSYCFVFGLYLTVSPVSFSQIHWVVKKFSLHPTSQLSSAGLCVPGPPHWEQFKYHSVNIFITYRSCLKFLCRMRKWDTALIIILSWVGQRVASLPPSPHHFIWPVGDVQNSMAIRLPTCANYVAFS